MTRKKSSKKQNRFNSSINNNVNSNKTAKTLVHAGTNFKIKGLINLGNTCYFNSMLQMILHSPTFMAKLKVYCSNDSEIIVKMPYKEVKLILKTGDVSCVEKELIKIWESDSSTISPIALRNALLKNEQFKLHFNGFNEQDSHEAFLIVLNIIKEAQVKRIRKAILDYYDCRMSADKVSEEIKAEIKTMGRLTEKLTLLHSHFGIVVGSALKCDECGEIRLRLDECHHISPGFSLKYDEDNNQTLTKNKHDESVTVVKTPADNGSHKKLSKHQLKMQKRMEKKVGRKKKLAQRDMDCSIDVNKVENDQILVEPESANIDLIDKNPVIARFFNSTEKMQLDNEEGIVLEDLLPSPGKLSSSNCSKLAIGTNSNHSSLCCQSPEEMDMIHKFETQLSIENNVIENSETSKNGNDDFYIHEDEEKSKFLDLSDRFLVDEDKGWIIDNCDQDVHGTLEWTNSYVSKDTDQENCDIDEKVIINDYSEPTINGQNDKELFESSSQQPLPILSSAIHGNEEEDSDKDVITNENNNDIIQKENNSALSITTVPILDTSCVKNSKRMQSVISATLESHGTRLKSRTNVDSILFDKETDLDRALAKFVSPMHIENLVCDSCSKNQRMGSKKCETNHVKLDIFCHTPFVLPIYVSRFKQVSTKDRSAKNNQLYTYPFLLNLSVQCSQFSNVSGDLCPVIYRLYGIIEHIGSRINSGHYVSYVCCPNDAQMNIFTPNLLSSDIISEISQKYDQNMYEERQRSFCFEESIFLEGNGLEKNHSVNWNGVESNFNWFRISDSHVEPVSSNAALNCQAFMLFYIRMQ